FVVFDPGGDEYRFRSSPTSIFGNFYCTSPLLVPWDRGKIASCSFVFPVKDLFPSVRGAASGWPWVPWSRKHTIPRGCVDVFDPGGDYYKFCFSAAIFGGGRRIFSLMWLPWDRGKGNIRNWAFGDRFGLVKRLDSALIL
ncbi:hypothetical protein A2U01_0029593, partial [Trifolium medium]|nr:hypothetical protein [Trifolium medium]